MKSRSLPFSLAAIALATATSFAPLRAEQALDTTAISVAPGRTGKMMPGDVYRVGLPRTDLHVTIDGLVLKPGFAVGGYAVYKAEPQGTLVLGDMVLLPSEVSAVQQSLESSGFTITILHNHPQRSAPRRLQALPARGAWLQGGQGAPTIRGSLSDLTLIAAALDDGCLKVGNRSSA